MSKHHPQPIAPDSVHLWRGYNIPGKAYTDFVGFLGSIFVPACALLQPGAGLHAYFPALPDQQNKPAALPDQTALMFWRTPDDYTNGFKTVAVRAYTNLHSLVYGPDSLSGFPIAFTGTVAADQPYFLINKKADWMYGTVFHLVGARNASQSPADFTAAITKWVTAYAATPSSGADGALFCANADYVLLWEHFADDETAGSAAFDALAGMVTPFLNTTAATTRIKEDLWSQWPGLTLAENNCLNIQLRRP